MKKKLFVVAISAMVATSFMSEVNTVENNRKIAGDPPVVISPPLKVIKKKPYPRTTVPKQYFGDYSHTV